MQDMGRKMKLPEGVEPPKHVAVIPDGNRRWARERGLPTLMGHRKGFDRAREIVRVSRDMGIHTLTLWGFSTENWKRSKREVKYLMDLFKRMIDKNLVEAHKHQSKIVHLGRKDRLPKRLLEKITKAETETVKYKKHVLNIGLDYNGRDELVRAIKKIQDSRIKAQDLSERRIFDYLDTAGQKYPEPDLVIRTSGELRYSGVLMYQGAYSEFYFEKKSFPDFTTARFQRAIIDFSKRNRRFGGN